MNTQNNTIVDQLTNLDRNVGSTERVFSAVTGGALIAYGLKLGGVSGTLLSVLGGSLAFRGTTGHCHMYDALGVNTADENSINGKSTNRRGLLTERVHVKKSITIDKSPAELYKFWQNFENLPKIMNHLESVKTTGEKTSHWVAKAPLGTTVEWDAETTSNVENERIGWKSIEGSDVDNSGVVEFLPTSDRGTEVRVVLTYDPPAGKIGALVAKLFGEEPNQQVEEDLRRFKQLMEAGTITTVEGQTSGREPEAKGAKA